MTNRGYMPISRTAPIEKSKFGILARVSVAIGITFIALTFNPHELSVGAPVFAWPYCYCPSNDYCGIGDQIDCGGYPYETCSITGNADWCRYPNTGCPSGEYLDGGCCWAGSSPILVDVAGNGFAMTDVGSGVRFPISVPETSYQLSWTAANSDDAWLALDRDGSGTIDSGQEMFGDNTPQPDPPTGKKRNGFLALAELDRPTMGGNEDGVVDNRDRMFRSLLLWQDRNHNGYSEPVELFHPTAVGIGGFDLNYKKVTWSDAFGNEFLYRSKIRGLSGSEIGKWAYDVFLQIRPS